MPALVEGQPVYIKGSSAKPYELKNTGGVLSCSCMAWRNQSLPIERRTCKHLKAHCGEKSEADRTNSPLIRPVEEYYEKGEPGIGPDDGAGHSERFRPGLKVTVPELAIKLRPDQKAKLNGPPVLLAQSLEDFPELDVTGWWFSEKLDGCRALFDGKQFITRQGNVYKAPSWFTEGFPNHPLDGELWMGRQMFQKTMSIVRRHDGSEQWKEVKFVAFDLPHLTQVPFEDRMWALRKICTPSTSPYLFFHQQTQVRSRPHLSQMMREVVEAGGEGLMLRQPKSFYEVGRSSTLLKMKPFKDAEAEVIGHVPGKGKHKGVLGGLVLRLPNGKEFNIGTGLTDAERRNPPMLGATITYRYTELTDDGIPKCAPYLRVRDDV